MGKRWKFRKLFGERKASVVSRMSQNVPEGSPAAKNFSTPSLTMSPKDARLSQLEAEIAELVAACLYGYLKRKREGQKEGVAIRHELPR